MSPAPAPCRESAEPTEEEFTRVWESHGRGYLRLAQHLLGSREEGEDAVQEGMLLAWRFRASFHREAALSTWLWTVIRRCCLGRLRNRKVQLEPLSLIENMAAASTPDPIVTIHWTERRALVRRLLPRLSDTPREFIARALSGEPVNWPTGAKKAAKHHALVTLKPLVKRMERARAACA